MKVRPAVSTGILGAAAAIGAVVLLAAAYGLPVILQSHPTSTSSAGRTTTSTFGSSSTTLILPTSTVSHSQSFATSWVTTTSITGWSQTSAASWSTSTTKGTAEAQCPSPPITTLPLAGGNFSQLRNIYSNSSTSPVGYVHNGFDLSPSQSLNWIVAPANGTIWEDIFWANPKTGNWQVNVGIDVGCGGVMVQMAFEPMSSNHTIGLFENATVLVRPGQTVVSDQHIAGLVKMSDASHVHFGINVNGKSVCPVPYLTQDVLNILLTHLRTDQPNVTALCYS